MPHRIFSCKANLSSHRAVVAAIMKLRLYIQYYNRTSDANVMNMWYESMIWAITEHGLSLFAASILAIRPFFSLVYKTYGSITSKLGYGSGSDKSASGTGASTRFSKLSHVPSSHKSTELGRVSNRPDFDGQSDHDVEMGLGQSERNVHLHDDAESNNIVVESAEKSRTNVEADEVAH